MASFDDLYPTTNQQKDDSEDSDNNLPDFLPMTKLQSDPTVSYKLQEI